MRAGVPVYRQYTAEERAILQPASREQEA